MEDAPAQPTFDVAGNRLTLLDTGERRMAGLIDLIAGARDSLRILYYIYDDDDAGRAVRDALIEAARRGVRVSMIVDGMGTDESASRDFFDPVEAAGIDLCRFLPRWGRKYLLRNHQKLAIADQTHVILGGFNIADDYFGRAGADGRAWRDLGLQVEGPAARHAAGYFDELYRWTHRRGAPLKPLNRIITRWSQDEGPVRWLMGGPTRRLSPWARAIKREIPSGAKVDVVAAYFAPSPGMLRRLRRRGRAGRVRIVVPAVTDHAIAIWAARFTYRKLLKNGVAIHEYLPTKLHTKLFVIDDVVHIGSANFDVRSLFLNLEVMLRVEDAAFADHCRRYVDGEVARSQPITPDVHRARSPWWRRVQQAGAYFVLAMLDLRVTRGVSVGQSIPWFPRRRRNPPAR